MHISFSKIKYTGSVGGEKMPWSNLSVEFDPILSSGYHVKVAINNRIIVDCIHKGEPNLADANSYAKKFIDNPIKYPDETIPG